MTARLFLLFSLSLSGFFAPLSPSCFSALPFFYIYYILKVAKASSRLAECISMREGANNIPSDGISRRAGDFGHFCLALVGGEK